MTAPTDEQIAEAQSWVSRGASECPCCSQGNILDSALRSAQERIKGMERITREYYIRWPVEDTPCANCGELFANHRANTLQCPLEPLDGAWRATCYNVTEGAQGEER